MKYYSYGIQFPIILYSIIYNLKGGVPPKSFSSLLHLTVSPFIRGASHSGPVIGTLNQSNLVKVLTSPNFVSLQSREYTCANISQEMNLNVTSHLRWVTESIYKPCSNILVDYGSDM